MYTYLDWLSRYYFGMMDVFIQFSPYVELCVFSVPCIVVNVYVAFRFSAVSTFNENFKAIMVITNFAIVGVSLFHAVFGLLPREVYSVERGHYAMAFLANSLAFLHQVCVYIFDTKFLIMGYERWRAFKLRAQYREGDGNRGSLMVFLKLVASVFLFAVIKAVVVIGMKKPDESYDRVLRRATALEASFFTFTATHVMAMFGWIYSLYIFKVLYVDAKNNRYSGSTLTESYQIKETITIVEVLIPLSYFYGAVVFLCTMTVITNQYYVSKGYWEVHSNSYQALCTLEYMIVDSYNVYASVYVVWRFRALRRKFIEDLRSVFKFEWDMENKINPRVDVFEDQADVHFSQLNGQWKL